MFGTIITQFANRNKFGQRQEREPQFNSILMPFYNQAGSAIKRSLTSPKKTYIKQYMDFCPELTALINMVAGDVSEKSYFEPINVKDSGRNRILTASEFADNMNMRLQDLSVIIDILCTGEGYAWIAQLLKQSMQFDMVAEKYLKSKNLPVNAEFKHMLFKANFEDEDLSRPNKYQYVASSTVENVYDNKQIMSFVQKVGVSEIIFKPEEIIHYKFFDIDGRVEGFTPVKTILMHLDLLRFMWKNSQAQAKNGGQPDRLYTAENIDANSPSYKRIEAELKKYHAMETRHGSLFLSGKITVQDLVQLDTMQFKELGLYITGLIAMQWSIPRSRIPYIVSSANTKDDTGGNSEKAYWRNIELLQDLFLNIQNRQLWIPFFKVKRKFKQAYKHDELIETQIKQMRINNLTFISNELAKQQKQLTSNYIIRYLNGIDEEIDEEDLEEKPEMELNMNDNNSMFRQGLQSNSDLDKNSNSDKKAVSDKKRIEQERVAASRNKPTGYGKELDIFNGLEIKNVSYNTFREKYSDINSKVYVSEHDGLIRFLFKYQDCGYSAILPVSESKISNLLNFKEIVHVSEPDILNINRNV